MTGPDMENRKEIKKTEAKTRRRTITRQDLHISLMDLLWIIAGSTLTSLATLYLFDPAGLDTGGVSGLSIVAKTLSGGRLPLWLSTLLFNLPIFLFAMKTDGFVAIYRTSISWLIMTAEFYFLPEKDLISDNLLLTAIFGGILFGAGTGCLLNARATSGGTDLLGQSLHHFFRQYSIAWIIQILDGIVVILGLFVFSLENTLYALISVFIMGKVADLLIAQGKRARMALIFSDENEKIAQTILDELDRGVTGLLGRGMYTGKNRVVLVCICSSKDIVQIKDVVKKYDPHAFFVITDVDEAMGEGFVEKWE